MAPDTKEWKAVNVRLTTAHKAIGLLLIAATVAAVLLGDHAKAQGAVQRPEFADSMRSIQARLDATDARTDTALSQIKGLIQAGQQQQLRVLCAQARSPVDICRTVH